MLQHEKHLHDVSVNNHYAVWANMKQRCLNPNHPAYPDYGGRGITICSRWMDSYEAFILDMGFRPSDQHSIERKDTNGNYEPDNCCWATNLEQSSNRRNNVYYTVADVKVTASELARQSGLSVQTIKNRLSRGLDLETAIALPSNKHTYTHNGVTKTLVEWSKYLNISYNVLYSRIVKKGWSFEKAIEKV